MSLLGAPLSVTLVAHGWPPERIGGVELYTRALHRGLQGLGVRSTVFHAGARDGIGPDRRVVRGPSPSPRSFRATVIRPDVEASFREWLSATRPEVVHFHHLTHLSLGLPRIAGEAGCATCMTLHDYWLPCIRGQLLNRSLDRCPGPSPQRCSHCVGGQLALEPATAALGRLLDWLPATARAHLREGLGRSRGGSLAPVVAERMRLVEAACERIQRFASPSRDLADRMARLGIGAGRIDVVSLPLVHPIGPAPDPGHGPLRFLYVGSLIPSKGPHLLLEAFARLPEGHATLRLAGPAPASDTDPSYAARLREVAARCPGVSVEGPFPPGGAQRLLDGADALVLPSLWEENSPLVVREATAAGLRVVASARGGVAELAPDARTFDPLRPSSLVEALRAEIREGRGRRPPIAWEGEAAHARRTVEWYRRLLAPRAHGQRPQRRSPCSPS